MSVPASRWMVGAVIVSLALGAVGMAVDSLVLALPLGLLAYWAAGWGVWRLAKGAYRALTRAQREEAERVAGNRSTRQAVQDVPGLLARLPGCVLLGGYGHGLTDHTAYDVTFHEAGVFLRPTDGNGDSGSDGFVLPLANVTEITIGGRGRTVRGGGFVGGGFGLRGALEGIALSEALNLLTERHSIETVVFVSATDCELVLFYSREAPEELRITLSPVLGRIQRRTVPTPDHGARLEQAHQLHSRGLLTDAELAAKRTQILHEL